MAKTKINVGCCGYPVSQSEYAKHFGAVELQSTFYRLPSLRTVERWREKAPGDFVFIVKAFQGITHGMDSPTWRRSNVKPNENHGGLRLTREVLESWKATREICERLRAPICVIQTPRSFTDSGKNLMNAERFFEKIDRGGLIIAFEPRGWGNESILKLCKRRGLVHVVDPFASRPLWTLNGRLAYFRLHGKPPGKALYKYSYTDADLARLRDLVRDTEVEEAYVMFNNVSMFRDALRFARMIGGL